MSSTWKYVAGTLSALAVVYALIIAGQILLGLFAAVGIYGTGWLFATFRPDEGYIAALGPARAAVLTLIAFVVLAYAVVIAGQILLGVIAVCVIALVGFVIDHLLLTVLVIGIPLAVAYATVGLVIAVAGAFVGEYFLDTS